jgi:predicted  nucleic acid-binding Zn-ribbon protein
MSSKKSPRRPSKSSITSAKEKTISKKSPRRPSTTSTGRQVGSKSKKPSKPSRSLGVSRSITSRAQKKKPIATVAAGTTAAAVAAGALSEETHAKLDELQDEFSDLQESMLLTNAHNEMADIETTLSLLPAEIEELRTRGYVFRSFLENKGSVLAEQWDEVYDRVSREVNRRTRELERDSDTAEGALRQAMNGRASQVARAESAIATFKSKVRAAQSAIEAMYQPLQQNVNQTRSQVEQIRWLLDQVDEAVFQLYPAEDPVMACQAQYMETDKEGPEGVLYLTDERLIFEQKEEIATKKVLFITTEKETVQELIFDVPVGQIEEVKASDKRKFLGHKEILELLFAPDADLSGATLRLLGGTQNEEWAGLLGRVKSREIEPSRLPAPRPPSAPPAARLSLSRSCAACGRLPASTAGQ